MGGGDGLGGLRRKIVYAVAAIPCQIRPDTRSEHLILKQIVFGNVAVVNPDMSDGGSSTLGWKGPDKISQSRAVSDLG